MGAPPKTSNDLSVLASVAACLMVLTLGLKPVEVTADPGEQPPLPGICSESDRFGVWDNAGRIHRYEVGQLHAGWYTSFGIRQDPAHPGGLSYVQTIRLSEDGPNSDRACSVCPSWEELGKAARENSGSLWLIGNEPDRQDLVDAGRYAELYHEFYTFLKAEDPACQVAIGGIVQPTPIRLQYLDQILSAYERRYDETMPVDVWNVHNYVIRESSTGWGCGLPPGTDPGLAIEYGAQDHDDLALWTGHLVEMRRWMRDRGYRDRPLIISEFGILMPVFHDYDYPRVRDFMRGAFDWLLTARDSATGYPADGDRLVQAWAWFSLDDPGEGFAPLATWNHLFDPDTGQITSLGRDFASYTQDLTDPLPGTVELYPAALRVARTEPGGSGLLTVTMTAEIHNRGTNPAGHALVVFSGEGLPRREVQLAEVRADETREATAVWQNLAPGTYLVQVDVGPAGHIVECNASNNSLQTLILVSERQPIYLPIVGRDPGLVSERPLPVDTAR